MKSLYLKNLKLVDLEKNKIIPASILIKNGRFVEVFSEKIHTQDLLCRYKNFPTLDLNGNFIIPGFVDAHTHLLSLGVERQRIDLSGCDSLSVCLEKLRENQENDLIFGVNWDESNWRKGTIAELNRDLLDKISDTKPVIMRRICGHFAVVNSKALAAIPSNYKIVEPSKGYLYENAALYLNQIFPPTPDMYERAIEIATEEALSRGITTVHEITDATGFRIYQRYKKRLKLRICLYLTNFLEEALQTGQPLDLQDVFLKFAGIKIFMDGSIGARTAALKKPYQGIKNKGKLLIAERELTKIFKKAGLKNLQLMIHSIGDRSTDVVLSVFKKLKLTENPLRHRLEHIELLHNYQIEEIAKFKLIASMQPNFLRWQGSSGMYEKNLGKRYKKMNCFKKLVQSGVRVIFGSDCMPIGPLNGINYAVNFPLRDVKLTPAQAFRFYTTEPHFATFDEDRLGLVKPGMQADLVVLNKNPLQKENLKDLKILSVFINGVTVYKK
ncbi:MAG: amidohydrolase [candidate division WOR-3 bacterium]